MIRERSCGEIRLITRLPELCTASAATVVLLPPLHLSTNITKWLLQMIAVLWLDIEHHIVGRRGKRTVRAAGVVHRQDTQRSLTSIVKVGLIRRVSEISRRWVRRRWFIRLRAGNMGMRKRRRLVLRRHSNRTFTERRASIWELATRTRTERRRARGVHVCVTVVLVVYRHLVGRSGRIPMLRTGFLDSILMH